jgi:RHS repeat-associated protein
VTEGSTLNYSYDSAGNVTNDGVHSFTYDAENRVVSVDGGSTATYSYDHQNRRVKKVVGSTTTHYVWQGGQVIAEHNGSTGAVITEYIFAGGRMIAREGGGRVFFLYDRLSARATITDGQGNIQGRQSHLPFGEELNATGTTDKHRFTSYERDSETGTDYAVNRQYAQGVGRFLRPDPYARSYDWGNPQSLNRYAYVQNDPANATDPLGLLQIRVCQVTGVFEWGYEITCRTIDDTGEQRRNPSGPHQRPRKQKMSNKDKFKKFLNSAQNKACRDALNAAYQDTIGGSVSEAIEGAVDQVDFYDTNLFPNEEAGVHFPSFLLANGIASGIAVGTVFGPGTVVRGQRVLAVTESPLSGLGSPGIYAPGGQGAPVFQGNDGFANIQHELAHYVTNKGDADFARDLGISDGDVKGWFERGCKNKEQE